MVLFPSPTQIDTWVAATWEDFITIMDAPEYIGGRGYGERGCQPDLAFYLRESCSLPPQDNAPIDVNCI